MTTLTEEALTQLLDEAASSYGVPEHGPDEVVAAMATEPERPPVLRRRWVQLSAAAALVAAGVVFGVAQYGGANGSTQVAGGVDGALTYGKGDAGTTTAPKSALDSARSGTQRRFAAPVPAAAQRGTVYNSIPGGSTGGGGGSAGAATGGAGAPGSLVAPPPVKAPAPDGAESRVVKTGSISLVVGDKKVSNTLTAVQRAAKGQGGYIAAGSSDEYGDTPSGEVTIRVPVDRFDNLVAAVRGLNAKVRTASTSGKDVTAQYADAAAQLRTLKATRERFLIILSKANTIGEILTVQQRVDSVSGQIDRLEGQQKLLASQSDLSTLTVSVSEEGDPVVKAATKPRSGLSQAFRDAGKGFVTGVEAIIRHSGRALLLLICLALAFVVGRTAWRVAQRRMV